MEYSKRYFTKAKREQRELEREIAEERAAMTEEEKAKNREETDKGLEQLLNKIHKRERMKVRKLNQVRWQEFNDLMNRAKDLANYMQLDIDIKTSSNFEGVLKLRTDFFLLSSETIPEAREDFQQLISKAEQVMITGSEDGIIQLEFWFSFFSEVFIYQQT